MVESSTEKMKIFISYARADGSALAEELVTGLKLLGFEPLLDRHDIAAAEEWEARLGVLIERADTIVFIISPAAVKSGRCAWEVDCAAKFGKRLIPIKGYYPVPEVEVPEKLRRLNYIFFPEGQSSLKPLTDLTIALRQDVEWVREHTRLTELATRWDARRRKSGGADELLLRGDDLTDATAWVIRRKNDAPEITALQQSFLDASESFATYLAEVERKQQERLQAQSSEIEVRRQNTKLWRNLFIGIISIYLLTLLIRGLIVRIEYEEWTNQEVGNEISYAIFESMAIPLLISITIYFIFMGRLRGTPLKGMILLIAIASLLANIITSYLLSIVLVATPVLTIVSDKSNIFTLLSLLGIPIYAVSTTIVINRRIIGLQDARIYDCLRIAIPIAMWLAFILIGWHGNFAFNTASVLIYVGLQILVALVIGGYVSRTAAALIVGLSENRRAVPLFTPQ